MSVSSRQFAFVRGRIVRDAVAQASETIYQVEAKCDSMVLKLDFDKAFDNVSWKFVEQVFSFKGLNGH